MKTGKVAMFFLILFALATSLTAQDKILTIMKEESEIVAHVKIFDLISFGTDEDGVYEWQALCQVVEPVKGTITKDEKIRFRFKHIDYKGINETAIVRINEEYIVFLKGKSGKVSLPSENKVESVYSLLDRWVGVMPYNSYMAMKLKELATKDKPPIPVTVQVQPELILFKEGKPLLMKVTISNWLSQPIHFPTFATKPNEWNGETMCVSLACIYRGKEKRNLYLAKPKMDVPQTISGYSSPEIVPGGSQTITVDISKWTIQAGWIKGEYELVFSMDYISIGDKITLSVLSDPVHIMIQ